MRPFFLALRGRLIPGGSRRERAYRAARQLLQRLDRTLDRRDTRSITSAAERDARYAAWLERHRATPAVIQVMRARSAALADRPTISIVIVGRDVPEASLRAVVESVRTQVYETWELRLVTDPASATDVQAVLNACAAVDPRIRFVHLRSPLGGAGAANAGLSVAAGAFVGFLDPRDRLYPEALLEIACRLNQEPSADIVYGDEDAVDAAGRRSTPWFKPGWSPDLLLSRDYVSRFVVYRRRLLEAVGGLREECQGAAGYDLLLRASEKTARIVHVPRILLGRGSGPEATAACEPDGDRAAQAAVERALSRRGLEARLEAAGPGCRHVRYVVRGTPLVSIIIPMRDRVELTRRCVASIETRSGYAHREVLVVDNGSTARRSRRALRALTERHRVLRYDLPFNYSAVNNFGARHARGDYLVFLNNDTEVVSAEWLEALLEHAQRPEVGAVGARLLYPDGRIQHAGVVVLGTPTAFAVNALKGLPRDADTHVGISGVVRNVSAVTGACMMVRRSVLAEVGGFDERLRVVFSDVDLCLRMRRSGYLVVYTPLATLVHRESATRRRLHPAADEQLVRERWRDVAARGDPYYNPNLTRRREDFGLD